MLTELPTIGLSVGNFFFEWNRLASVFVLGAVGVSDGALASVGTRLKVLSMLL